MKKNIQSLEELQLEIELGEILKNQKEKKLRSDIKGFSEKLKPANLIKSAFTSFTGNSELKSQVTARGLEAGLGLLITNFLFKNSNPVIKTAAAVLGTAFAGKVFGDDAPRYVEKFKALFEKIKNRKSESKDNSFNESDTFNSGS